MTKKEPEAVMNKGRIEALTDGVYAIAMTLLALNLTIPEIIEEMNDTRVREMLSSLMIKLDDYFLSFMFLAIFWIIHNEQMRFVRKADRFFLWLQILCLVFVVLIPTSTSLVAYYGGLQISDVVFEMNILIISLLYLASWQYILRNPRLSEEAPDRRAMDREKAKTLLIVIFSVIAMIVSFISPGWSTTLYFLLPVLVILSALQPEVRKESEKQGTS